ncbi:hypothetical protein [Flavobacterium sp. FlaQc-50]|uniref:hypothetical protein n=1 Tax=unclassified Flavobacterium TaxID=196869 RepID=UPI003756AAEB
MTTINSLSGGPTSSYLAVHHPADVEMFAMVCVDDHNAAGWLRRDKKALQYANDKLESFIPYYGEFRATAEDPIIIYTMMQLEQKLGREIKWVRGLSFENMINKTSVLPNQYWRFCTTYLKLIPIFEYCYINFGEDVLMRLGIRHDEEERRETINNKFEFPFSCNNYGQKRQNWKEVEWRNVEYPLIESFTTNYHVNKFWTNENDVIFAEDTNCQMCFWKDVQQLRKNFDKNPQIMHWGAVQEVLKDATFKKEMSLLDVKTIGIQMDFNFGTGAEGCKSGWCRG